MKIKNIYTIISVLFIAILFMESSLNSARASEVIVEKDIVYGSAWNDGSGADEELKLDLYQLEKGDLTNRPIVILVHGGGFGGGTKGYSEWQGNFYPDMATAFANEGYVAVSIDYRLWPGCPEDRFYEDLDYTVEDVKMALNWIKAHHETYGVDTTKVIIGGDSAGGGIAVNASFRVENNDLFCGCISLWGGLPPYGTSGENPVNACELNANIPPTCFIHGTADEVVPFFISENLEGDLNILGIYTELHPLDGLNHYPVNTSTDPDGYHSDLVNEIIDTVLNFSKTVLSMVPSGIPPLSENKIYLFPNPVLKETNHISLGVGNSIIHGSCQIFDASGKLVSSSEINNSNTVDLDIRGSSSGVYIVIVRSGRTIIRKKMVVV